MASAGHLLPALGALQGGVLVGAAPTCLIDDVHQGLADLNVAVGSQLQAVYRWVGRRAGGWRGRQVRTRRRGMSPLVMTCRHSAGAGLERPPPPPPAAAPPPPPPTVISTAKHSVPQHTAAQRSAPWRQSRRRPPAAPAGRHPPQCPTAGGRWTDGQEGHDGSQWRAARRLRRAGSVTAQAEAHAGRARRHTMVAGTA